MHKTERPRDDGVRLETIIARRAAPGYVLVWSHQHQPASVNRDEIRLIKPQQVEWNAPPRRGLDKRCARRRSDAERQIVPL